MDSINEIIVSSYNAQTNQLAHTLEEIPKGYAELFSRNRYLVQPPEDFLILAKWCLEHLDFPETPLTLDTLKLHEAQPAAKRRDLFFKTRSRLANDNVNAWMSLNSPFQPLWEMLQKECDLKLKIVTTKNSKAVFDLCEFYKMDLQPTSVMSTEHGTSKTGFLKTLLDKHPDNNLLFIDDSIHNLLNIKQSSLPTRLHLALASWGYVGPKDCNTAADNNIEVFSMNRFLKKTF